MDKKKGLKILLLGNIKEDKSISMKIYGKCIKKMIPNSTIYEPSCKKLPLCFSNFSTTILNLLI